MRCVPASVGPSSQVLGCRERQLGSLPMGKWTLVHSTFAVTGLGPELGTRSSKSNQTCLEAFLSQSRKNSIRQDVILATEGPAKVP